MPWKFDSLTSDNEIVAVTVAPVAAGEIWGILLRELKFPHNVTSHYIIINSQFVPILEIREYAIALPAILSVAYVSEWCMTWHVAQWTWTLHEMRAEFVA